ncbi:MAG: ABC transporter permease [Ilumatobacteraceae bacterium]|nr:ABC transporter permease [Ilumatobacteraceae bacterium]MDP4735324.1 ABC transporter permease [Ilumatobacteraceae bacterium]MDP4902893.1 ABC transporter permease [Ilumatobacteraceae bacterium]MDP4980895.1 ABC transporter permease [Ilumatobacteraceae bacterium]
MARPMDTLYRWLTQIKLNKSPRLWAGFAIPGTVWLIVLFAIPFYAVACVAFGTIDPVFRDAVPQWNPLSWNFVQAQQIFTSLATGPLQGVAIRTVVYVVCAMSLSFVIGFPIAYFLARHAGKRKILLLVLIIVPFWVNYLMRMLAWVNLLSVDGLFTRFMRIFGVNYNWLDGSPITVILGLVYGYIPFLILPLYATLERLDWRLVDAARDLGANSRQAFRLVTLPMSKAGLVAAGILIALPMFGDYYTNDLLSRSPSTEMIGNQIDFFLNASSQPQNGALLVLALSLFLLLFMSFYLRSTRQQTRQVTR